MLDANINICKLSNFEYEIIFLKAGDITLYQVWNEKSPFINGKREIITLNIQTWVNEFDFNEKTTLMEIGDCKYVFVIKKIELKDRKMRWVVGVKEIVNKSKTVSKKIPIGKFNNVNFNVDWSPPVGSDQSQILKN